MIEHVRQFLRARWAHFRSDRTSQIILLACLVSFPPAFYYGQLMVRALLLALLVLILVAHSTLNSWTELVVSRLDPSLPPVVGFYRLFLRDPDVQGVVASGRWFLNVNICLLLLGNPLWIPLVDVLLGACFFLTFATADELHIRATPPPGRPVDPSGSPGGGWRSSAEYVLGHAQNNPRRAMFFAALGAGLGYAGKALVDGVVQDRVNANQVVRQASSTLETARQLSSVSIQEALEKSRIQLDGDRQHFALQSQARAQEIQLQSQARAQEIQLQKELDTVQMDNKIRLLEAQSRLGAEPPVLSPLARKPDLLPTGGEQSTS